MTTALLLQKPLVTDKATALSAIGKYVFVVSPNATKPEIKKAVKELYRVDAVGVAVVNIPAKHKKFRGIRRATGGCKKAIVTLKKGQKIDIQ